MHLASADGNWMFWSAAADSALRGPDKFGLKNCRFSAVLVLRKAKTIAAV